MEEVDLCVAVHAEISDAKRSPYIRRTPLKSRTKMETSFIVAPKASPAEPLAQPTGILKSEAARRILLVVASFIFALSLIEVPALINILDYRVILGENFAWWPANNINDHELIHIRRPYVHFSGETRGGGVTAGYRIPPSDMTFYRWDVAYDHNGFRNQTDLKSADIVVIGDSFVEGLTVSTAELTTSLLAQLQGKVVANLGQSAYGPQQELIVLKRYGLPLHPRTIVWMFSENTDLYDVVYYDHVMNDPPDFLHAFWARSFTKIAWIKIFHGSKRSGAVRAGVCQTPANKPVTVYFPSRFLPLTKQDLGAIDETAQIIAEAHKLSAAQGARLIFVFVPDKFRVLHEFCKFSQESECRNWSMNDLPVRLEKAVRSISPEIGYLDLTPKLVDTTKRGVLPYYSDDVHWSPVGHKVAADEINSYLFSTESP